MSESVSGVDAIVERLREEALPAEAAANLEPAALSVNLHDAVAAVHATVREIETWLRETAVFPFDDVADEVARQFGGTE